MKVTIILTPEKELSNRIEELYLDAEYWDSLINTNELDKKSAKKYRDFISGKYKKIHQLEKKLEEMQRRN